MISRKTLLVHTFINLILFTLSITIGNDLIVALGAVSMATAVWLTIFFFALVGDRNRLFHVVKTAYELLPEEHKPEIEDAVYKAGFCPSGVLDERLKPR
jgi:hypothetical protein